jgi:NADH-quinone oxidoreductase subunit J
VSPLLFFPLAAVAVAAALTLVLHRNPVHSACALAVVMFVLSIFFVGLHAELVAVLQLIVYAGAIVILFLFIINLLNLQAELRALGGVVLVATASVGGGALAALLVAALRRASAPAAGDLPPGFGETEALARQLFTVYLVPFELTSVLLLVAIVGAVALARKPT